VDADQILVHPSFTWPFVEGASIRVGPVLKYTRNDRDEDQLVNLTLPYGSGRFGQLGLHGTLEVDGRDQRLFPRRGAFLAASGAFYPRAWDVDESFGEVHGSASAYISGGRAFTLALRGGAKKVFGTFPYFEGAVIGGGGLGVSALDEADRTVRGFRSRRFVGDASLYGTAEVRLRVAPLKLVLPGHFGLLGFVDSGRVYLKGEDSGAWHTGAGGGIWYSLLNDRSVFSAGLAHSKESDLFYFRGGFTF
jgi:outer membrane protein assembly factor BamA